MYEFILSDYEVLTQSGSGWHKYLRADIIFEGAPRKLVIFFENEADEKRMADSFEIRVRGKIKEQHATLSLLLDDVELIESKPKK